MKFEISEPIRTTANIVVGPGSPVLRGKSAPSEKIRKNSSKWVDVWGTVELASRAATTEGGRETGCRSRCNTPDRLFSPLEGSSLTVWLSTGRARSGWKHLNLVRISPENAEKRKKIELCAACHFRHAEPAQEVGNPDLKSRHQQWCRWLVPREKSQRKGH